MVYHTKKPYSVIKRNEVPIYVKTQMNPENNILSEISQTQNDKYCMIHLHEISRIDKFIKTENRLEVTRDWGREEWRVIA